MSTARALVLVPRVPAAVTREALALLNELRQARARFERAAEAIHQACDHDRCQNVPDGPV